MGCSSDPAGPAFFFFCLSPVSLSRLSPSGDALVFSTLDWSLSWIRPQLAHTPPTGPARNFGGVASLSGSQNRTQGHTGGEFVFLPKTSLPLPQRGRGWVSLFLGLLGLLCSFTNGSHGSNSTCLGLRWCRFPYPAPKTAHRGTQGRGWFHRLFLVRFFCGSPASCCSRWQFTASWMGKIV